MNDVKIYIQKVQLLSLGLIDRNLPSNIVVQLPRKRNKDLKSKSWKNACFKKKSLRLTSDFLAKSQWNGIFMVVRENNSSPEWHDHFSNNSLPLPIIFRLAGSQHLLNTHTGSKPFSDFPRKYITKEPISKIKQQRTEISLKINKC